MHRQFTFIASHKPLSSISTLLTPTVLSTRSVLTNSTTAVTPFRFSCILHTTPHRMSSTATTTKNIFVTRKLPNASQERLEKGLPGINVEQWTEDRAIPREILLEKVKAKDGLLCLLTDKIDAEILDAAGPQLKVVSTMSVGYDHVDLPELESRNIVLGITPGVLTEATADTTLLLVLAASRRLREGVDAVINGQWGTWSPTWLLGSELGGGSKTVGIVGLGRIGVAVAHRLKAFGVTKFLYQGTRPKPDVEAEVIGLETKSSKKTTVEFVDLDRLLKESDVICVCCALNKQTANMFDYQAFSKMKSTVVFVNTARGGIVDQEGLIRALKENKLGMVGLDVTVPEPLPVDSELLKFPNCIVLPHIGSGTLETRTAMSEIAIENVVRGVKGEKLLHSAD